MRVLILLLLLFVSVGAKEATTMNENCSYVQVSMIDTTTVEGKMIKILSDSGYSVRMQQIILAQAKFESGNFKNSLTRKHNNVFGMLHSKRDPYSVGNWGFAEGRTGYAVYNSINESVYARMWYSRQKGYPKDASVEDYVHHMKQKKYFEATEKEYLKGLKKLINQDSAIFQNKNLIIACN